MRGDPETWLVSLMELTSFVILDAIGFNQLFAQLAINFYYILYTFTQIQFRHFATALARSSLSPLCSLSQTMPRLCHLQPLWQMFYPSTCSAKLHSHESDLDWQLSIKLDPCYPAADLASDVQNPTARNVCSRPRILVRAVVVVNFYICISHFYTILPTSAMHIQCSLVAIILQV